MTVELAEGVATLVHYLGWEAARGFGATGRRWPPGIVGYLRARDVRNPMDDPPDDSLQAGARESKILPTTAGSIVRS
jgi:hypothetical protein